MKMGHPEKQMILDDDEDKYDDFIDVDYAGVMQSSRESRPV